MISKFRDLIRFALATPRKARAVNTSSPLPVAALAAIPEAGPCGFTFDINSIPYLGACHDLDNCMGSAELSARNYRR